MDPMTPSRRQRRTDALSADAIVQAAITILDSRGEEALTFRALADALETGPGAIYHHLPNKHEILTAAAARLVSEATRKVALHSDSAAGIRELMLALFDLIDAHPWIGTQLAREPWQSALGEIFARIGEQLERLGVAEEHLFVAASSLVNFVLGVAGQYAAAARFPSDADRTVLLRAIADDWRGDDRASLSFAHRMADRLADHDERQQFADGIEFLLVGIVSIAGRDSGPAAGLTSPQAPTSPALDE